MLTSVTDEYASSTVCGVETLVGIMVKEPRIAEMSLVLAADEASSALNLQTATSSPQPAHSAGLWQRL